MGGNAFSLLHHLTMYFKYIISLNRINCRNLNNPKKERKELNGFFSFILIKLHTNFAYSNPSVRQGSLLSYFNILKN